MGWVYVLCDGRYFREVEELWFYVRGCFVVVCCWFIREDDLLWFDSFFYDFEWDYIWVEGKYLNF